MLRPVLLAAALLLVPAACDSVEEQVTEHYERGAALLAENQPEKAMLEFRNVLQLDRTHVPSIVGIASALEATGDLSGAVRHLVNAIEYEPNHVAARIKLAQAMLLAGELERAKEHADIALAAAPENTDALAAKAAVALRLGNTAEALEAANTALGIDPDHPGAGMILIAERIAEADRWEAIALVDRFLAANPENLALNLVKLQLLEQDDAKGEAMAAHLARMVEIYPEEPAFRVTLARFQRSRGDNAAALETMRALADLDPADTDQVLQFVRFLNETEGADAAQGELEARIAAAGDDATAAFPYHAALAELDLRSGDKAAAAARFDRLIAEDGLTEAKIARTRLHLAENEREAARALVDEVIAADAKNVDALAIRAALEIEDEDADKAILTLRSALNEAPQKVELLRLSAMAHERAGNRELALENLAAAVRLSGYEPDLTIGYVRQLATAKQVDAAATVLEEAIRRHPGNRTLLTAMADIRLGQGDWAAAEAIAGELEALDDTDTTARKVTAAARQGQGRIGETIEILEGLAANAESRASTMTSLVRTYVQAGRIEEADRFLAGVLEDNPENATALMLRAALEAQAENWDAARTGFEAAVAAEPANPRTHLTLMRYLFARGEGEAARAALEAGLAAIQPPDDFALRLTKAQLLEADHDYDGAIALYRALYESRSESMVVANNLASLLSDHHADDAESRAFAVKVARRLASSDIPQFQDTHGWTLYLAGQHDAALRSLVPAAEALPENAWVQYHLGMTYAALDQDEKAREHLERARELGGDGFPRLADLDAALAGLGG